MQVGRKVVDVSGGLMKTKKQLIYEFIVDYSNEFKNMDNECPKIETTFLSEQLNMQRSNVSSALNQLVKEGKIIKSEGRPVLYSLANDEKVLNDDQQFSSMIGYDQSLKEVIKIVRIALAYPTPIQSLLILGEKGVGVEELSLNTYHYACSKGILKKNAPYTVIDSSLYTEDQLKESFISDTSIFEQVNHGLLLIKNATISNRLFVQLMNAMESKNYQFIFMIHTNDQEKAAFLKNHFNFTVHIPSLNQRSYHERYELIEKFVREEASKLNKRIEINFGLMQSLLLFPTKNNLDGLKKSLQFGIASSFARSKRNATIVLELSDFNEDVRKGLLYVKEASPEIKEIIGDSSDFIFSKDTTFRTRGKHDQLDIYHKIDKKRQILNKSINSIEMDHFVFNNIENELNDYLMTLIRNINEEKLKSIVSPKLIELVRDFINRASKKFNHLYPNEIFFGICIHLNNILVTTNNKQRISNKMIMEIIEKYDEEYFFSKKFLKLIESEFHVKFSLDETVFITLFLTLPLSNTQRNEVVTLIAMHGENGASSIVEVVKKLIPVKNIHAFDLSLQLNIEEAYDKLKQKLVEINQGKGIIVIYDMGSFQIMLDSIREETKLNIRYIEMPISLLAMSCCKYSEEGHDIDEVYSHLLEEYSDKPYSGTRKKNDIIIALSSIKENLSKDIKEKLLSFKDHEDYLIMDFNIDEKQSLIDKINEMNNRGKIVGIIGTYDPDMFNLKFIDYYHLSQTDTIRELFEDPGDDFDLFEYLNQQFNSLSRADLEITLIPFISKLETSLNLKLKEDERIGLLIHMTSLIDRLLRKQGPVVNFNISEIIEKYPGQVDSVKQALLPIERHFDISISDGDAATIVRIVLKC